MGFDKISDLNLHLYILFYSDYVIDAILHPKPRIGLDRCVACESHTATWSGHSAV